MSNKNKRALLSALRYAAVMTIVCITSSEYTLLQISILVLGIVGLYFTGWLEGHLGL